MHACDTVRTDYSDQVSRLPAELDRFGVRVWSGLPGLLRASRTSDGKKNLEMGVTHRKTLYSNFFQNQFSAN
jgi:hypothetical protein